MLSSAAVHGCCGRLVQSGPAANSRQIGFVCERVYGSTQCLTTARTGASVTARRRLTHCSPVDPPAPKTTLTDAAAADDMAGLLRGRRELRGSAVATTSATCSSTAAVAAAVGVVAAVVVST
eukprot:363017-Chlamydomonas_euryale.AAC.10